MSTQPLIIDPAQLPPHQPLDLSRQQRAAMPPVRWEDGSYDFQGERIPVWVGHSREGEWQVGPNEEEHNPQYEVSFRRHLSASEEVMRRRQALRGEQVSLEAPTVKLGYTLTPELAKAWVDQARKLEAGVDLQRVLDEAGFYLMSTSESLGSMARQRYEKKLGRHRLSVSVSGWGCKVEFLRSDRHVHENLCRVRLADSSYKGEALPVEWPAVVAVPNEAGLLMALAAATEFERTYTPGRRAPRPR